MDVDSAQPTRSSRQPSQNRVGMFDLTSFPFTPERVNQLQKRRKAMNNQLFFDSMLNYAGVVNPASFFPPPDTNTFLSLLDVVNASGWERMKLDCVLYYLLCWWDLDVSEDNKVSTEFCEQTRIPSNFAELTHAYFLFDSGDIIHATTMLCTPRIPAVDAVKVLQTIQLCQDIDPAILVLRSVRMAKPSLVEVEALDTYIAALARIDICSAWTFQRSYANDEAGSEVRERLLSKILDVILIPKPSPGPLRALVAFPMHTFEQEFIHRYTLNAPLEMSEPSLAALQDLVIIRLAQLGQYSVAVKLNREFTNAAVRAGRPISALSRQKSDERKKMLSQLIEVLPAVERKALAKELGDFGVFSNAPVPSTGTAPLEMSWETVPRTTTAPVQSSPAVVQTPSKQPNPNESTGSPRVMLPYASSPKPSTPLVTNNLGKGPAVKDTPRRINAIPAYLASLPRHGLTGSTAPSPQTPFTDRSDAPSPSSAIVSRHNTSLGKIRTPAPAFSPLINNNGLAKKTPFFDPNNREKSSMGVLVDSTSQGQRDELDSRTQDVTMGDEEISSKQPAEKEEDEDEEQEEQEALQEHSDDDFVIHGSKSNAFPISKPTVPKRSPLQEESPKKVGGKRKRVVSAADMDMDVEPTEPASEKDKKVRAKAANIATPRRSSRISSTTGVPALNVIAATSPIPESPSTPANKSFTIPGAFDAEDEEGELEEPPTRNTRTRSSRTLGVIDEAAPSAPATTTTTTRKASGSTKKTMNRTTSSRKTRTTRSAASEPGDSEDEKASVASAPSRRSTRHSNPMNIPGALDASPPPPVPPLPPTITITTTATSVATKKKGKVDRSEVPTRTLPRRSTAARSGYGQS